MKKIIPLNQNIKITTSDLELYAYLTDTMNRWFPHWINKEISILDFGCGDGILTSFIQKSFYKANIIGVDIDPAQLRENEERYPEITFFRASEDILPFQDCMFDLIYSVNVFHHIAQVERKHYASKLMRLLKLTGTLIIFETNPYNWRSRKAFQAEHNAQTKMLCIKLIRSLFNCDDCSVKGIYLYPNLSSRFESFIGFIPFGSLYAVIVTKNKK